MSVTYKWREINEKNKLRIIFKKYDLDKNKSLSEDELFIALIKAFNIKIQLVSVDACKELIRKYMKQYDADNDGKIQFDEFFQIYKAMKTDMRMDMSANEEIPKEITSKSSKYWDVLNPQKRNHKLLLCCDGGGVRGLISITFLYFLEKELGCRLCDVFDMCSGTSTGSLIAGGIAGMKLSARNVRKFYELDNLSRVMPKSLTDKVLGVVQGEALYKCDGKVEVLEEFFGETKMKESGPHLVIPVYNITKRTIETFTKRKSPELLLKDVINASSAAPVYYPPWKIGEDWYIDGGVVANDPSMCALGEAITLWGDDTPIKILSIGTGLLYKKIDGERAFNKKWGALQWFGDGDFVNILLDSSAACLQATDILGDSYYRVNDSLEPYHISEEIDDISTTNFSNLIHMGEKLWELHKETVIEFLTASHDDGVSIYENGDKTTISNEENKTPRENTSNEEKIVKEKNVKKKESRRENTSNGENIVKKKESRRENTSNEEKIVKKKESRRENTSNEDKTIKKKESRRDKNKSSLDKDSPSDKDEKKTSARNKDKTTNGEKNLKKKESRRDKTSGESPRDKARQKQRRKEE